MIAHSLNQLISLISWASIAAFGRILTPAPIGWPIVIVIWCIAGKALLHIARHRWATRAETNFLARLSATVKADAAAQSRVEPSETVATVEQTTLTDKARAERPGSGVDPFRDSNIGVMIAMASDSLVIRRCADVILSQRDHSRPDMAGILETAAQPYTSRLAFPHQAPNLTMLVGLVGTILGLAAVVSALGPEILNAANSSSPQELARAISPQIQNLGTAFVCTMHGIIAAVIVALSCNREEFRQNRILAQVETFCLESVAPLVYPMSLESQLARISEVLKDSRNFMEAVYAGMQTAVAAMKYQVDAFGKTTANASESLGEFLLIARHAASKLDISISKLDASITSMSDLQKQVHGVYTSLMERHDASEQNFKGRVEEIVSAVGGLQAGFNKNSQAVVEQLQSAANNYERSTADFREASTNFRNMSKEIGSEAYQAIAATADQFRAALTDHRRAIDLVESSLREMISRLDPSLLTKVEWQGVLAALNQAVDSQNQVAAKLSSLASADGATRVIVPSASVPSGTAR